MPPALGCQAMVKFMRYGLFVLCLAQQQLQQMAMVVATSGVASKPPMGFNNCNVRVALGLTNWTCCSGNQALFEATATALKAHGLLALGYQYINTDDGWMNANRSHGGRNGTQVPQSQPWRFPDWQGMIDTLHSEGFKFGLYTAMGTLSCCKRATSCLRETVDAEQYAKWGVDYVKDDSCSSCESGGTVVDKLKRMQDALDKTNRKILLSGEGGPPPDVCSATGYCGNLRRIGHDITPFWSSIVSMIDLSYGLAPFAHNASHPSGAGFWNDMDVLEVGNGEFDCSTPASVEMAKAHFGMWAMMKSPLLLGTDMTFHANPDLEETILDIVGNPRVLAINQDALGRQARRVASLPGPTLNPGDLSTIDTSLVIAACNSSRPTQRWRHNHSGADGAGPLWTEDAAGTRWCATSLAAGLWNTIKCDEVNSSTICQGARGPTCLDIRLCSTKTTNRDACHPVNASVSGRQDITLINWQNLHGAYDHTKYGSGPFPHSRYMVNAGPTPFTFDTSLGLGPGSSLSPKMTVIDDDNVGHAETAPGDAFCLDVVVAGRLEVWVAPLSGGRHAVGLLNRSPIATSISATWSQLGLGDGEVMDARDAWTGERVGTGLSGSVSAMTAGRGLSLVILSPA